VPVQQPGDSASCAICGRTILPGERITEYVAPDGESVGVCALCKPRAEASGWIPAEHAGRLARETAPQRRSLNLRQRFARASEAATARLSRAPAAQPDSATEAAEERPAEPRRAAPKPRVNAPQNTKRQPGEPLSPERLMRLAVESFNAGPGPRKIAGLIRSLGKPQVAVRGDGAERAKVTVAWEISWYQWEVALDGKTGVREVRKGSEVSELEAGEQRWNASAADDGSLRLDLAQSRSSEGTNS
jgi:hypothetical protein